MVFTSQDFIISSINFSLTYESLYSQMAFNFLVTTMILARLLRHAESLTALTSEVHVQAFMESESGRNKYSIEILIFIFIWVLRSEFKYLMLFVSLHQKVHLACTVNFKNQCNQNDWYGFTAKIRLVFFKVLLSAVFIILQYFDIYRGGLNFFIISVNIYTYIHTYVSNEKKFQIFQRC